MYEGRCDDGWRQMTRHQKFMLAMRQQKKRDRWWYTYLRWVATLVQFGSWLITHDMFNRISSMLYEQLFKVKVSLKMVPYWTAGMDKAGRFLKSHEDGCFLGTVHKRSITRNATHHIIIYRLVHVVDTHTHSVLLLVSNFSTNQSVLISFPFWHRSHFGGNVFIFIGH